MSSCPNPVQQATLDYLARGWKPLPLRPLSKQPVGADWRHSQVTALDVPQMFNEQSNVGILLGEASGNLVDVDIDAPEALALADAFLPSTTFVSGRPSRPRSHRWFRCESLPRHQKFEFDGCLLELRVTGQTMTPPSLHPSGEQVVWHEATGELPVINPDELAAATRMLAAATLLCRKYPAEGSRHGLALAISGFLLRNGWDVNRTRHFIVSVATAAGDTEIADRETAVETTAARLTKGETALGGTRFAEIIGPAVFEKLAEWLGFARTRFQTQIFPVVEADRVPEEQIPALPEDCLEGDWLSELTFRLFENTAIPPQYLRESVVLVLGSLIEGKTGFPTHSGLCSRRYLSLISEKPQAGKGASWQRVAGYGAHGGALRQLLDSAGIRILHGSGIGSGQFLAAELEQYPRAIAHYDEAKRLFSVGTAQNSTLLDSLLTLFESTSLFSGSFTNRKHGGDDLHLSVLIHSTRKVFGEGFGAAGATADGLLSRFVLAYSERPPLVAVWAERDFAEERRIVARIRELLPGAFVPLTMEAVAAEQLAAFVAKIKTHDHPHPDHTPRLDVHVKVDALMRAVFSGSTEITATMMSRSILWGEHQLALRVALWPSDGASRSEQITQCLLRRLRKGTASARDLRRAAHVDRDGSHELFARALSALCRSGAVCAIGQNHAGKEIFALEDSSEEREA